MSLLVWLPLISNYENQGLSDLKFTPENTSYTSLQTGGKIGSSAYYNSSESVGGLVSNKTLSLGNNLTMCCWFKFSSLYSGSALGCAMGGQHRYSNSTGMGLTVKYISGTTGYLSCNTGNGGGSGNRTYNTYCGSTLLSANTWYHVAMTYNGSTIKLYVNGKLDGTHTHTGQVNVADYVTVGTWSLAGTSGNTIYNGYKLIGNLNDFRIYNHTLNPKEIKEIAKGLVAHYKMNTPKAKNYVDGKGFHIYNNHSVSSSIVATGETYRGYPVYRLTQTPTSNAEVLTSFRERLHSHGVFQTADMGFALTESSKWSYWLYVRPVSHPTTTRIGGTASNIQNAAWTESSPVYQGDGWYRVGQTRTVTADRNDAIFTSYCTSNAQAGVPIVVDFCGPHLLKGTNHVFDNYDKYVSNNGILEDASGYSNNLIIDGNVIPYNGSPKYNSCLNFNQSGYFYKNDFNMTTTDFTISFWLNPPYTINAQHFLVGTFNNWTGNGFGCWRDSTGGGYSTLYKVDGASSYTGLPGIGATHDAWQHIAYVRSGTQGIYYKNGVEVSRVTGPSGNISHPVLYLGKSLFNNATSQVDQCSLSDFRFYSTALSAADVKELYNTPTSLTNNGILMTGEFVETETTTSKIEKDGQITSSNFSTKQALLENMKVKALGDGSSWARIHHLDVRGAGNYFSTAEVANCDMPGKFSKMNKITNFKDASGKYEFMLTYPTIKKYAPAGYTLLDCIEATGKQYINTGVYGYSDGTYVRGQRWEFDISMKSGVSRRQLMGYGGNGGEYWGLQLNNMYGVGSPGYIGSGDIRTTIVQDYSGGTAGGNTLWVDRANIGVGSNLTTSQQYQLFCIAGDTNNYGCCAKLYRCKCIQGTSLIRDYIPVRRNYDGAVGLYDLVGNKFYGNNGSGAFLAKEHEAYMPIDYIESNGNQYIDTGIAWNKANSYKMTTKVVYTTTSPANQIMGFTGNRGCGIGSEYATWWECSSHPFAANTTYDLEWGLDGPSGNNYRTINGTTFSLSGGGAANWVGNMHLFAAHLTSSQAGFQPSYHCHCKMYGAKIYVNNKLVRDYIPAVSTTSGKAGLYDKVNHKFYPSGSHCNFFTSGVPKDDSPYEFLDYVQTNGNQIIDTGIAPNSNTQVDIKFSPVGSMTENAIFGSTWSASGFFLMFYQNFIRWHSRNLVYDCTTTANNKIYNCFCDTGIKINRRNYSVTNNYGSTADSTSTIKLFSTTDLQTKNGAIRLYYCDIYKDGSLQRSFHPVRRKSDGAIGLLDSITGGFYSSSFSAGPTIYPKQQIPMYNRWVQDSWTTSASSGDSIGSRKVFTSWPEHNGPIKPVNSGSAIYDCDNYSVTTWYAPIGQTGAWEGGIPAANGSMQKETELWVRFDKHADIDTASIQKGGSIGAKHIMEI